MRQLPLMLLVLVLSSGCIAGTERDGRGQDVPRFPLHGSAVPVTTLQCVDSTQPVLDLRSEKGHVVLITFWASWCGPCQEELPELSRLATKYREQGLRVIGIDQDEPLDVARKWMREKGVDMPLYRDPNGSLSKAFLVFGLPSAYVIGRDGKMWRKEEGYQGPGHWERRLRAALEWKPTA